ncbi:MAG: GyrI-like domain-containing protein, partial [Chitinophagaceae bacterium]|nr:GyrI-like domain-containing protein [Chitinophagaceae bacterium]
HFPAGNESAITSPSVGFPVDEKQQTDGDVIADSFPAGKYLSAKHIGHYDGITQAHMELEKYAHVNGLKKAPVKNAIEMAVLVESYITDEEKYPDPSKWETEIFSLLA